MDACRTSFGFLPRSGCVFHGGSKKFSFPSGKSFHAYKYAQIQSLSTTGGWFEKYSPLENQITISINKNFFHILDEIAFAFVNAAPYSRKYAVEWLFMCSLLIPLQLKWRLAFGRFHRLIFYQFYILATMNTTKGSPNDVLIVYMLGGLQHPWLEKQFLIWIWWRKLFELVSHTAGDHGERNLAEDSWRLRRWGMADARCLPSSSF